MIERLPLLLPEIAMFIGTCAVMLLGLSPSLAARRMTAMVAAGTLVLAGIFAANTPVDIAASLGMPMPALIGFGKGLIAIVGLLLVLLMAGTVDRRYEQLIAGGRTTYSPLRAQRAEFYSFFMFSLTGAMLCASADDLIWLFLALELTSLPTYVMVVMSRTGSDRAGRGWLHAQEAGVKYFFLGALGAAIFLYGFALLYGGTGSTNLVEIAASLQSNAGPNAIALTGLVLAMVGISFKIAAVPMHFYTADVYEGASAPMAAFLAFTPKTAGIISIVLLLTAAGWGYTSTELPAGGSNEGQLHPAIDVVLWIIAVATMTVGNVLAWLQTSIKRIFAYSSIAHSGYMLVGLIAGPGDGSFAQNGVAATLFYLLCYGVMNVGAFGVLACLENSKDESEVETVADLRGLGRRHAGLGWIFVICTMSLLGLPPLLGFIGKLGLFTSGISAGRILLVVCLGLNSAIAAFYYLRLVALVWLEEPEGAPERIRVSPFPTRRVASALSAGGVVALAIFANGLMNVSEDASRSITPEQLAENAARQEAQRVALPVAADLVPAESATSPQPVANQPVANRAIVTDDGQAGF